MLPLTHVNVYCCLFVGAVMKCEVWEVKTTEHLMSNWANARLRRDGFCLQLIQHPVLFCLWLLFSIQFLLPLFILPPGSQSQMQTNPLCQRGVLIFLLHTVFIYFMFHLVLGRIIDSKKGDGGDWECFDCCKGKRVLLQNNLKMASQFW